uniref:Uncharacterized protein n=1 Tax=Clytia hemisphaerica TaxID=252671 RepID=A0A7M5UNH2_9CNID
MGKTTMSITAQAQIKMDLGEDRKNDLKFLYRPPTPKAAVVASMYSCKDWPLIDKFMIKSLKYFEPVIEIPHHAMLQVKKWKDICIAFKGKELKNYSDDYMVWLDNKKYYKKDWGPIFLPNFSKLNNADYYLFEKDDSFSQKNIFSIRSESKNLLLSAGLVAVNGGNPYGKNMFLSQIEEKKVIVKVILTENDICLLASQQEPDRFLMMKKFEFSEYDHSPIEFGDGVPDFCGWWRFDIRCDGKSLTTSEFDGTSKNFYNDDCIII